MRPYLLLLAASLTCVLTGCDEQTSAVPPTARTLESVGQLELSESAWRERLTPDQFHVLRQAGTERPFSSPLLKESRRGTFVCAGCALPLFDAATKFDSGTGWPSFWDRIGPDHVLNRRDFSHGMVRTENVCGRCGSHLGHVFEDGPAPTGLRYCINGDALAFEPATD